MADTRPPGLRFNADATAIKASNVWTDRDGQTLGTLDLSGGSYIVFRDPHQARDMMAELAKVADEMEAEIARAAKEKPGA